MFFDSGLVDANSHYSGINKVPLLEAVQERKIQAGIASHQNQGLQFN